MLRERGFMVGYAGRLPALPAGYAGRLPAVPAVYAGKILRYLSRWQEWRDRQTEVIPKDSFERKSFIVCGDEARFKPPGGIQGQMAFDF